MIKVQVLSFQDREANLKDYMTVRAAEYSDGYLWVIVTWRENEFGDKIKE